MLTKAELVERIALANDISKAEAHRITDIVVDAICDAAIENGGVQFTGKFTIDVKERAERTGKNPRTGEEITIPASKSLHIKTGKAIKEALNA